MTETEVKKLVEQYIDGWRKSNLVSILKPLAEDVFITESHGPTYHGKEQVKEWVEDWIQNGYRVTQWDMDSFFFDKDTAFFEWIFKCITDKKHHKIDGASVIKFRNKKIYHIHEYRMTKPAYDWNSK